MYEVAVNSSSTRSETERDEQHDLLQTPLHPWHVEHAGRMVDFAGWSMPVQYGSIIDEHLQTRKCLGLFDVSHMARLFFSGPHIDRFLDRLTTRRMAGIEPGKIRYSLLTNESGGILDDVLVYHLPGLDDQASNFMMVVNASNRGKIVDWINSHLPAAPDLRMEDRTIDSAMIAVQGPLANQTVAKISETDPNSLPYYTGTTTRILGHSAIVSRTGYTGEDGCEIIVDAQHGEEIWARVFEIAQPIGGGATGLAARDTLRLEAGMPLYGHELSTEINPVQTDLNFAINLKDREFAGRSAIVKAKRDPTLPTRIGLELTDRRAAREHCEIFSGGQKIGVVTSGTFGPTVNKSISMGYVQPEFAVPGTKVDIDIRGKSHAATVVDLPFYRRS
jgi:aminomethyltransferase